MRGVATAFVASLVLAGAGSAAATQPHVDITRMSPAVVHGTGFVARERVTVTVSAKGNATRAVTASPAGAFTVRFAHFSIPRCTVYGVRAKGNRGSYVFWKVVTMCAQPASTGPTSTEPSPLTPTDPTPKKP